MSETSGMEGAGAAQIDRIDVIDTNGSWRSVFRKKFTTIHRFDLSITLQYIIKISWRICDYQTFSDGFQCGFEECGEG